MLNSIRNCIVRLWDCLHEFFTLRNAEHRVTELSVIDRIELRTEVRAAVQAMREAACAEPATRSVELGRAALQKLVAAAAVSILKRRSSGPLTWPEFPETLSVVYSELPQMTQHEYALQCLVETGADSTLAQRQFALLSDLFAFLEGKIEVRTPRDFYSARWLRFAATGITLVCCGWYAFKPTNLAREKWVTASSLCSDIPEPAVGAQKLARVVDGIRYERRKAACTNKEVAPWIRVDLGASHSITEVVVYPRTDGHWGVDDLPVSIELSQDDEQYRTVAVRSEPYTPHSPWRLKLSGTLARYVRIAGVPTQSLQLFVSEIEVYGS